MTMRYFVLTLIFAAHGAFAAPEFTPSCPAPLEFAETKAALLEELRRTKSSATGLYLTRRLVAIYTTAPNRQAQEMLSAGVGKRNMQALDEAESILGELIAYCPDFAEGYHQRALVRRKLGDLDGALSDLDQAIAIAPNHLGALSRKAQVLAAMGRFREGEAVRDHVRALNPWMPERFLKLDIPGTPL